MLKTLLDNSTIVLNSEIIHSGLKIVVFKLYKHFREISLEGASQENLQIYWIYVDLNGHNQTRSSGSFWKYSEYLFFRTPSKFSSFQWPARRRTKDFLWFLIRHFSEFEVKSFSHFTIYKWNVLIWKAFLTQPAITC